MPTPSRLRVKAEELLRAADLHAAPIPVDRLARRLGAELRYEPFEGDASGMLYREGDQIVIGVNALHPKTRQRFTIAHEIGHLVLHRQNFFMNRNFRANRDGESSTARDPEEIAANQFAAEILMPARMLADDLAGRTIDPDSDEIVEQLAEK